MAETQQNPLVKRIDLSSFRKVQLEYNQVQVSAGMMNKRKKCQ